MIPRVRKLLLASSLLFGSVLSCAAAHAYYPGYPLYGYGPFSSALWPLRAVLYPLRGVGYGYGYGYGALGYNAAYFANSLVSRALYSPFAYPRPYMGMQEYEDEEPLYAPRRRARPKRPQEAVSDQVASAQWSQPASNPAMPMPAPGAASAPPAVAANSPQGYAPPGGNAPLAQGFVNLVNSRFDGNISQALFDPEARAWARSIGLINKDDVFAANLSNERVELIERVFKDESLPAHAKIHTTRVLLQH
jgi:hypothetical protein